MESLLAHYTQTLSQLDGNVFKVFSNFYSTNLSLIDCWLETQFQNKVAKSDRLSTFYRQEGNKHYGKKDLLKSLEFYTKSLCYAIPNGKEYGLALANRSAVTFEMKDYENCIQDIDLCLATSYPSNLKPKIYLRKADCYYRTGQSEYLSTCLAEVTEILRTFNTTDADKFIRKVELFKSAQNDLQNVRSSSNLGNDLPKFEDNENSNFAYTSSKITMGYDEDRGRHVLAKKHIKKGDILFLEKAFIFAPVFNSESKEFNIFKCYNCLKDVMSSIPCTTCTRCVYCNEECRIVSWEECHQWECEGMQTNIWYDIGIGYPALKALLKGSKVGFLTPKGGYKVDLEQFGNVKNNYPYFNRLISNIYKNKNVTSYIVMSAVIVTYLRNYTNFFVWYLKQNVCPKDDLKSLVNYVGGLITKHIAQLSCNSSIIEHWTYSTTNLLVPDVLTAVACGMFPSVSIMNHSCQPNVTNFFIGDTIIVKALNDIPENKEVFNCYGIDYRTMTREHRQLACKSLYYFNCNCSICSDPNKELIPDCYLCPKCKGPVPDLLGSIFSFCMKCNEKLMLDPFRKLNEEAQQYLEEVDTNQLNAEYLTKSLQIRENLLYKQHKDFEEVYYRLHNYYVEVGDEQNMFKYVNLWLDIERYRRGNNSRLVGIKLYESSLAIIACLHRRNYNSNQLKKLMEKVEHMIREAKAILNLYYPEYITNELSNKKNLLNNCM